MRGTLSAECQAFSMNMKFGNALLRLRQPTRNILDWGLTKRWPAIKEKYEKIREADNDALLRKGVRGTEKGMDIGMGSDGGR